MAGRGNPISRLFTRAMLRGTAFSDSYAKLRALYALEDPWDMGSQKEQYRFQATSRQLTEISARFMHVLELGCGEGHQSTYLTRISDRLSGLDISPKALARARERVPTGSFKAGRMEDLPALFGEDRFDLITACEVLYYSSNLSEILDLLQSRADRLYVSNYAPRAVGMKAHFVGPGWRQLEPIRHGATVWECQLWESAQTG